MRIVRYFFVGGVAAAVDFLIFAGLVKSEISGWFAAALISFTFATWTNYYLSIRHVFDTCVRFDKQQEILMVFIVSGIGLAINQTILFLLIDIVKTEELLAKLGATGVVFFWNYFARSKFIFQNKTC